jgi:hypothetical protein
VTEKIEQEQEKLKKFYTMLEKEDTEGIENPKTLSKSLQNVQSQHVKVMTVEQFLARRIREQVDTHGHLVWKAQKEKDILKRQRMKKVEFRTTQQEFGDLPKECTKSGNKDWDTDYGLEKFTNTGKKVEKKTWTKWLNLWNTSQTEEDNRLLLEYITHQQQRMERKTEKSLNTREQTKINEIQKVDKDDLEKRKMSKMNNEKTKEETIKNVERNKNQKKAREMP